LNLHLVGGAVNVKAYEMTCEAISKYDPQGSFVYYHGHLAHTELSKLMLSMDLFCFASSCETMPNTLIEAMCSGLPIVCSNRGPMPEILKDAGIYFDPYSADDIASVVERVINDDVLLKLMAEKARIYSDIYSWKTCSDKTFNLVKSVLG
jgi:glycosyltransferase involved in cell wall biosynthesis